MFEKADWLAKPTIAARIPAPVSNVVPKVRSAGMVEGSQRGERQGRVPFACRTMGR